MWNVWEKQMEFYLDLTKAYSVFDNSEGSFEDFAYMLCDLENGDYKKKLEAIYTKMKFIGVWPFRNIKVEKKDWKQKEFSQIADRARELRKKLQWEEKYVPVPYKPFLKSLVDICKYIIDLNDNIHHCICEELFRKTLRGDTVFVYIDNYNVIRNDNGESATYMTPFLNASDEIGETVEYIHCSVVSEDMLFYDKKMFDIFVETDEENRIEVMKSYKPYFSEFIIPVDQKGRAKGKYDKHDELESLSAEEGWFIARFIPEGSQKVEGKSYVEGGMLTFASPPDYTKGKLEFKNRIKKEDKKYIEHVYSRVSGCDRSMVDDLLRKYATDISKASVYNIGHGNFVTLDNDQGETKVVYDMGLPYLFPIATAFKTIKTDYKNAYHEMVKTSTRMVIISHWDCDHYLGAYCNTENVFDVPWITSFPENDGYINAKRIMVYLSCNERLYAIERDVNPQLVGEYNAPDYVFELYRGKGKSTPITPINCQGLSIKLVNKGVATLMCGDIPYDCLPDTIISGQNYEYVIIPHHASNMSDHSLHMLDTMSGIHYPIICVDGDEKLGNTKVKVRAGEHCKRIRNKTIQSLYFTDDVTHKFVTKYKCDLSAKNSIVTC